MKCFTSRALHLILRVLVQITSLLWKATRENAKGVWGVHEAEREAVRRKTLPFPHTEALVWAVTAAQRISPQGAAGTSTAGQRLR